MKNLIVITLAFLAAGCGYTFQGTGSVLPPDVKTVHIPTVDNQTSETRFTQLMTESLRERFERFGVVTVVEKASEADAILNVEVKSLDRQARSVTSGTDIVLQYDSIAKLWGELRKKNGAIVWRNPQMVVVKPFGTTSDTVVTSSPDFAQSGITSGTLSSLSAVELSRGQEQEALISLAEEAARHIYDEAVAPDF